MSFSSSGGRRIPKGLVALLLGFILGFAVSVAAPSITGSFLSGSGVSDREINDSVSMLYGLVHETPIRVMEIGKESPFYRVVIAGKNLSATTFLTEDGTLLVENPIVLKDAIARLESRKGFFTCLRDAGVVFYGVLNDPATIQQINILGGTSYVGYIFQPVTKELLPTLTEQGVSFVPAFYVNGRYEQGVQALPWFSSVTGCALPQE